MKAFLLSEKSAELVVKGITRSDGWINFNPLGIGYFQILYLGEFREFIAPDENLPDLWGNEGFHTFYESL